MQLDKDEPSVHLSFFFPDYTDVCAQPTKVLPYVGLSLEGLTALGMLATSLYLMVPELKKYQQNQL